MLTWALKKILGTSHEREIKKLRPFVDEINKGNIDGRPVGFASRYFSDRSRNGTVRQALR